MPILDVQGNPITVKRPPEGRLITIPMSDFISSHPSNELTPLRLGNLLREAESGYIERQMELAEDIEEKDWHIASVLQTRKRAVAGLPWTVLPFDESKASKTIADFVTQLLQRRQFVEMRRELMDAVFKGIAVLDIDWRIQGKQILPVDIQTIHSTLLDFSDGLLKIRRTPDGAPEEPPPYKTIQHRYLAKAGTTMRGGLVRTLAWAYVLKHFAIRSWLIFAEACGMPLRIGKYPEGTTDEQKRVLKQAVKAVGLDFAAIIPEGMMIEFVEAAKNSGQAVFEPLARYIDSGMTRLVLGQTLTTQGSEGGYGSRSLGEVHEGVAQDLLEDDAGSVEETIQTQFIEPAVVFNFGADAPMPRLKLKCEPKEDLQAEVDIDEKLARIGVPLGVDYFYERYGRPKPEKDAELLKPPPAAIPGFAGRTPLESPHGMEGEEIPPLYPARKIPAFAGMTNGAGTTNGAGVAVKKKTMKQGG